MLRPELSQSSKIHYSNAPNHQTQISAPAALIRIPERTPRSFNIFPRIPSPSRISVVGMHASPTAYVPRTAAKAYLSGPAIMNWQRITIPPRMCPTRKIVEIARLVVAGWVSNAVILLPFNW